jgi:tetratricopeptide (TPR) repeat protein
VQRLSIALTAIVLIAAVPARADEPVRSDAQNDPRVAQARTACLAGDVQQGIRLLAELFTATNDPGWLFNQGRCYQQNGMVEMAISRFREFLRKSPESESTLRRQAHEHIDELEHRAQASRAAEPLPAAHPATNAPSSPAATPAQPAGSATVLVATPPASPTSVGRYRVVSLVLGGLGVAGLAAGLIVTLDVRAKRAALSRDSQNPEMPIGAGDFTRRLEEGQRRARLQLPLYLAGGLLAAGGVACYWFGVHRPESERGAALTVLPFASVQGGGVALVGRFQ